MNYSIVGTLKRYEKFASQFIPPRNVDIWLPPEYDGIRRMPVIYMQDGHNLFDPAVANGGEVWAMDKAVTRLAEAGEIDAAIVVGVWDTDQRFREYMPEKALGMAGKPEIKLRFEQEHGGLPISDPYLRFVVEELKPLVDREYVTRPGPADTFIMGSSMGALLALYALCEYPDVFGGSGCLSTHWPAGESVVVDYMKAVLPVAGRHRIYFDYGTETLDAIYKPYQERADAVMRAKGYQEARDWVTLRFEGAEHSERAWGERVAVPLTFLLGRDSP